MEQIFNKIVLKNNCISVWKINSPLDQLVTYPDMQQEELNVMNLLKNKQRKIEFIACRIALKKLFHKDIKLQHYKSGKPFIKDVDHLSISHSKNYIALAFGPENIGIDIEEPQQKMLRIISRILSEEEQLKFQKHLDPELACKLWSSKEAVLKFVGDKKIDFKKDIYIEDIDSGKINYLKNNLFVQFEYVEEMLVTIASKLN
tara:strand:- start:18 stop:623 length:606 start_codon:yes stop_codon:yes gene_type:complete